MPKMRLLGSADDYAGLLAAFYSYFGGVELLTSQQLGPGDGPDLSLRLKSRALVADLML